MQEGVPIAPKVRNAQKEAFSANVRLPQNWTAIKLAGLRPHLEGNDPTAVIDALLDSELSDKEIDRRIARANAQHRHHNIGKELYADDIVRTHIRGNQQSLYVLGEIVGVFPSLGKTIRDDAENIKGLLNESGQFHFIKKLIDETADELEEEETKKLMSDFKQYYVGWEDKTEAEKIHISFEADTLLKQIILRLTLRGNRVWSATPGAPEEKAKQRQILTRFVENLS